MFPNDSMGFAGGMFDDPFNSQFVGLPDLNFETDFIARGGDIVLGDFGLSDTNEVDIFNDPSSGQLNTALDTVAAMAFTPITAMGAETMGADSMAENVGDLAQDVGTGEGLIQLLTAATEIL